MISEQVLSRMVDDAVRVRLDELRSVAVQDSVAKSIIRAEISKHKNRGEMEVGVIDLHFDTKLPIEQIARVMKELKEEGIISDAS